MGIVKYIPNTITSMNLLCGVLGVISTFNGRLDLAFCLMLAAATFDFCDGLSARLLKAYSDIGKELDSLSDMVSFGVLPAIMLHYLMTQISTEGFLSYVPLLIAIFSGLRLAKFNIDENQTENFIGLATPACAILCGSFAYYISKNPGSIMFGWASWEYFIPAVSIILSALLVCNIPMFSMKIKKHKDGKDPVNRLRIIFGIITVAAAAITAILGFNWSFAILLTFIAYIVLNIANALFFK